MAEQNTIKITVLIGGRPYPLKINSADETAVRKIVKEVNDKVASFQTAYQDRDKQDGLSMTLLTYAFDLYKLRKATPQGNEPGVESKVAKIDDILEQML